MKRTRYTEYRPPFFIQKLVRPWPYQPYLWCRPCIMLEIVCIEVDGVWWRFVSVLQWILDMVQASCTQILIMVHFLTNVTPSPPSQFAGYGRGLSPLNRIWTICTSLLLESCTLFCQRKVLRRLTGHHGHLLRILRRLHFSLLCQFVRHSFLPLVPFVQKATGPGIASCALQCSTNTVKQDTFTVPVARRATTSNIHKGHTSFHKTHKLYLRRKVTIMITTLVTWEAIKWKAPR